MNTDKIPASIEASAKQILGFENLANLAPPMTRVYITDMGTDPTEVLVTAAKMVTEAGYRAVPHFASRRLISKEALETRVKRLALDAGVKDVLIIGGGLAEPNGVFNSSLEVLETGFFDQNGITQIGIAGHPEGAPEFSDEIAQEALRLKQDLSNRSDANFRIVTQFGFNADGFINWAEGIKSTGIDLPVHIGVAGPAKLATLLKFAALCGVGNSISFLKKRSTSLLTLASGFDPEDIASPIENHWLNNQNNTSAIAQIHIFPFGGLKKSAEWLESRGTWVKK